MANTYTQLNIHAVFSIKGRENLLSQTVRNELFPYIAGIIKNAANFPLAINGYKDHVHLFFELDPSQSISDVLEKVKSNSSKWINEKKFMQGKFAWQAGYAAFSYSRSQREDVIQYIVNQEQHHKRATFRDEYLNFLEKFKVDYDSRYLFEFYD
jgi:REP element-mobilizing transposase RayT